MTDDFISYTVVDKPHAEALVTARGLSVWWDPDLRYARAAVEEALR